MRKEFSRTIGAVCGTVAADAGRVSAGRSIRARVTAAATSTGLALGALLLAGPARAQAVAAPKSFEVCAACHSLAPGDHINGPSLAKLMNRQAGSVEGFRYSGPMKRSGLVWNAQTLRQFLTDPQGLVPGNRMPFSGMDSPAQVAEVVDYLAKAAK